MSSHRSAPTASMGYSNGTTTRRSSGKDAIYNNTDVAPQSTTTTTSRQSLNGVSIPVPIQVPIPPPTTQHRNYSNKDTENTTTYGSSKFISAVTNSTSTNPRAPVPSVTYTSSGPHLGGSSSNSRSLLQSDGTGSPGSFTVPPPSPPVNRASATPSISSLIDPVPTPTPPTSAPVPTTVQNATPSRASNVKKATVPAPTSAPSARTTSKQRDSAASKPQLVSEQHVVTDKQSTRVTSTTTAMDIVKESSKSTDGTAPNSSAPSPKPVKEKVEKPAPQPPVHRGNGLLSGDMFSMKGGDGKAVDLSVPTIHLHIPMQGESNKYVNFAKMAEDKYGWAALHPALAKVQENLASMSGDEMAVDGSDSESNPEDRMVVDSGPEKPAAPAKKKRKVQDLYDASDPFIDDSEQMWEEQAAATKDGFFVYSGPLVREGETAQIERADGTIKRPGRGRGRGGGRGGARSTRAPAKPRAPRKKAADKVIKAQEKTAATAA